MACIGIIVGFTIICLLQVLPATNAAPHSKGDGSAGDKKLICYYSSWSGYRPSVGAFTIDDIPVHLCTHIVYAFIGLNNRTWELLVLDPTNDITKGGYRRFTSLKKRNSHLKTLISVGGWVEGGQKYSEMVSKPERRKIFVNSVVDFLKWFNFDGLDLDWEFPGSADRHGKAEDKENFVQLVKELRDAFDKEGWGWTLTAVVPIMRFRVENGYDVPKLSSMLDHIHLLTYDLRGNWTGFTDVHAPLRAREFDLGDYVGVNMNDGAQLWQQLGAPTEKLTIGLPLYGRTYTLADAGANGLHSQLNLHRTAGSPGPYTKANGTLAYYEICELFKSGGWEQKYDNLGESPYMVKGDQWIGYDDRHSLIEKVKFVQEKGFGGVTVWSVDLDDFRGVCGESRILLHSIYKQLTGKSPLALPQPGLLGTTLFAHSTLRPATTEPSFVRLHTDVAPRHPPQELDQSNGFISVIPITASTATASHSLQFTTENVHDTTLQDQTDNQTPPSLSIVNPGEHLTTIVHQNHFRSTVAPVFRIEVFEPSPPSSTSASDTVSPVFRIDVFEKSTTPTITSDSVPRNFGSVPPSIGSLPPSTNSLPPSTDSLQPSTGSVPPITGSVPPSIGSVPPSIGSVPPRIGSEPLGSLPPTIDNLPPSIGSVPPGIGSEQRLPPGIGSEQRLPPTIDNLPPTIDNLPPTIGSVPPGIGNEQPIIGSVPPSMGSVLPSITSSTSPFHPTFSEETRAIFAQEVTETRREFSSTNENTFPTETTPSSPFTNPVTRQDRLHEHHFTFTTSPLLDESTQAETFNIHSFEKENSFVTGSTPQSNTKEAVSIETTPAANFFESTTDDEPQEAFHFQKISIQDFQEPVIRSDDQLPTSSQPPFTSDIPEIIRPSDHFSDLSDVSQSTEQGTTTTEIIIQQSSEKESFQISTTDQSNTEEALKPETIDHNETEQENDNAISTTAASPTTNTPKPSRRRPFLPQKGRITRPLLTKTELSTVLPSDVTVGPRLQNKTISQRVTRPLRRKSFRRKTTTTISSVNIEEVTLNDGAIPHETSTSRTTTKQAVNKRPSSTSTTSDLLDTRSPTTKESKLQRLPSRRPFRRRLRTRTTTTSTTVTQPSRTETTKSRQENDSENISEIQEIPAENTQRPLRKVRPQFKRNITVSDSQEEVPLTRNVGNRATGRNIDNEPTGGNRFDLPIVSSEKDISAQSGTVDEIFIKFAPRSPASSSGIVEYVNGKTRREAILDNESDSRDTLAVPKCGEGETYSIHQLCEKYWWCIHGRATLKECEMGLLWNPETNSCDWAGSVERDDCE